MRTRPSSSRTSTRVAAGRGQRLSVLLRKDRTAPRRRRSSATTSLARPGSAAIRPPAPASRSGPRRAPRPGRLAALHVQDRVRRRPRRSRRSRAPAASTPEAHALLRLQEGVGLLVAEQPRLDLDLRAVVVGERLAPVAAVGVAAPAPDLLRRQLRGDRRSARRPRECADGRSPMKGSRLPWLKSETGPWTVVAGPAQVHALRVDRPGVHLGEAVARGERPSGRGACESSQASTAAFVHQ